MVYLSKIYTKTGDNGTTQLGDGSTLPKHHLRVTSYGTVDELSSFIGLALVDGFEPSQEESETYRRLRAVQNDLFDVGSDLCVPGEAGEKLRISKSYTERIESWIDEVNADLEPLSSFVLPGGTRAASYLHVARTVCRRAEREVAALAEFEDEGAVNPEVLRYLNRLSDLLFVLSRAANEGGKSDVLWVPGQNG
ncbi:MAG: cob(I)yrinic acid a,c-diamide adenosyltransferase [Planctomycetota bacterium]|nr:cob(I)yrinic acid a,c-diamide adenosyltransferase [Planctomycetota bacterium]MEC8513231.1 cob(I)yrinic acid a,c-diamide adenosyltransferase [Planctomycetota bacterium]